MNGFLTCVPILLQLILLSSELLYKMEGERKKPTPKRIRPKAVQHISRSTTLQSSHDRREEAAAKLIVAPQRKMRTPGLGHLASEAIRAGGEKTRGKMMVKDRTERKGFDILQHTHDKDTYPTTLPDPDVEEAEVTCCGYAQINHLTAGGPKHYKFERRFCEITLMPTIGLSFCHKLSSVTGAGKQVPLLGASVIDKEDNTVELRSSESPLYENEPSDTIFIETETKAEANSWLDALTDAIKQAADDAAFNTYLEETYGVGLDFLAETEKEERVRNKANTSLFPKGDAPADDELFLIQLPDRLPTALTSAEGMPPPKGQQGKPATAGAAAQAATPNQNQRPGTGWTGRVLGEDEAKASLSNIPSGVIGKIQVRKSGRVTMKIGECQFDISSGGEATYAQSLCSVRVQDSRYRAEGWGATGCPVFSGPSTNSRPVGITKQNSEIILASREVETKDEGTFIYSEGTGWVPTRGPNGGAWTMLKEQDDPKVFELGQISKKIVVTPNFDYFDIGDSKKKSADTSG